MTTGTWTVKARRGALAAGAGLLMLGLTLTGCSGDSTTPREEAPPLLEAEVLSFSAPTDETVYAVARGACTGCVDVWTWSRGEDEWARVSRIDEPPKNVRTPHAHDGEGPLGAAGLQMAADGRHGYLNWYEDLWRTTDGGRTWQVAVRPAGLRDGEVEAVTAGHAFFRGYLPCARAERDTCVPKAVLRRAELGTDGWSEVELPAEGGDPFQVIARDGVLTLTVLRRGTAYLLRSRDEGAAWSVVEAPRDTTAVVKAPCEPYAEGEEVFVVACPTEERYEVDRGYFHLYEVRTSEDGEAWGTVGEFEGSTPTVVAIEDDRFLLVGESRRGDTRILEPDGSLTKPDLPDEASDYGATVRFVSAKVGYWHTYDDLLRTSDGGQTWAVIARAPEYAAG